MKNNIKVLTASAVVLSMGLASCNDLDTFPQNNYVTTDQKLNAIAKDPDLGAAGVVGISSVYPITMQLFDYHFDFGWPAMLFMLDNIGPDLVGIDDGYNWFSMATEYSLGNHTNVVNQEAWYLAYKIIKGANDVVGSIDPETDDKIAMLYAAQGYAQRAYAYLTLAQLFQYTYVGHESLPCVPILTNLNADQVALDGGCPRNTVQEVYDQIISDCTTAIDLLTKSGLPVTKISSIGSKRYASLGVAYGLRARANLIMNKWAEAASDADLAIKNSGCTPLSIEEAAKPGFWNSDDHECMWAVYITETDRCVTSGIVNFPSHMGSFNSNGYWTVGAIRKISKALYNTIPTTDARKGWWLNGSGMSNNLTDEQQSFVSSFPKTTGMMQVKFGPYKDEVGTTTNANDYFLMRVEEMYLIKAEATGMTSAGEGKKILEDFVKTYRDPSYTCSASTSAELQNEVWRQRRIELWGEGHCYFDLLRLNKALDRRGAGYESVWVYYVEAPLKPLLVPIGEMNANKFIGENNDSWSQPTAVSDN